jgi:proline-specific peptidase
MAAPATAAREGRIPFRGYETWYRVVGEGEDAGKLPLLCLHGGPGALHDYLEPLEAVAGTGRRAIFYDQLGCGRSDQPSDPSMWTVELFVDEVGAVREALGLDRVHLFGNSWGGMLAMEYAFTQPAGLASLVISSSPASIPLWAAEANRLRSELPEDVRAVLDRHEQAGTTDDPEYAAAEMEFYRRHLCRLDPWPDCLTRSMTGMRREIYETMQGPNEFVITGTLADWDITGRLGEIRVPTLVTSGRFDEATPRIAEEVHHGIPGSEWVVFEESAHCAFLEEPERYLAVLDEFLTRVERAEAP